MYTCVCLLTTAFHGVALESDNSTFLSKEAAPGTCQWTKLNFILVKKQVQDGTLYKGNNDVGWGFIGCHMVFIRTLPVQCAFSGPAHLLPVA